MVDEVLVSSETPPRVTGQDLRRLVFRAERAGDRDVACGERNAYRRTQADRPVEKTQENPRREHHHDARTAAAPGAAPPWTVATPLTAHVPPSLGQHNRSRSR